MKSLYCVLVAGGTGGHINAAIGLGQKLNDLNIMVKYFTGERPLDYKLFQGHNVRHLKSWPLRSKNVAIILKSLLLNIFTFLKLWKEFFRSPPVFVVGAGGYVCGPTLLAARMARVPVYIIEQNSVMGLTNKLLSPLAQKIFLHFHETHGLKKSTQKKVVVVGNPIRKEIVYSPIKPFNKDRTVNILVFGGSLGATQVNTILVELAQHDFSFPIHIIHQTGSDTVLKFLAGKNVTYESFKYLDKIQELYKWCDLIISRAGASTVAELRVVGKPSFLIPYPQATDNHQYFNAASLRQENHFDVRYCNTDEKSSEILHQIHHFIQDFIDNKTFSLKAETNRLDSSLEIIKAIKNDIRFFSQS